MDEAEFRKASNLYFITGIMAGLSIGVLITILVLLG